MRYDYDSTSLKRDGRRWFPIMGEIHYSRVPREFWAETLEKMGAGGVDIVSAYVIWIHHEEVEGEYDWGGRKDLREFLRIASSLSMKVCLRIGPWCHGEVRNGGFPDWLLRKGFESRTNDERYFSLVDRWYRAVHEQARDFLGETVIAVQIENEYGHCGGLYEREGGEAHMRRLTEMARKAGFDVPLYTATGWGGAWTGGLVPVMGGYCDAPWDPRTTEIEPSGNYVFTHERNDHNIGSDFGLGHGITFDVEKFPYLTAELGGGLQVTAHRRTVAAARDIASVALVKMGSGCNLLGFYMYAGGTNPDGKLTTLQESKATGSLNDLPEKSYDFRAPVREFGQVSDTLRELKLLAYFAHGFGEKICPLPALIPEENPLDPSDTEHLRHSWRTDGKSGYVFVNNYVRHQRLPEHEAVLKSPDGKIEFPRMKIKNGDFFFLPFNMEFGRSKIEWARATPLALLDGGRTAFYAREGEDAGGFFKFATEEDRGRADFVVLSRENALNSWLAFGRLFVTDGRSCAVREGEKVALFTRGRAEFRIYPDFVNARDGWKKAGGENLNLDTTLPPAVFARYEAEDGIEGAGVKSVQFKREENRGKNAVYSLNLAEVFRRESRSAHFSDVFVKIRYEGESARLYSVSGGKRLLLLDDFWAGADFPWEIGLRRFASELPLVENLELEILPLERGAEIYFEKGPDFRGKDSLCSLDSVEYDVERKFLI